MNKLKKTLALLLSLVMILSLLPAAAFAVDELEPEEISELVEEEAQAAATALPAAVNGVITLTGDVELAETVTINETVVIDLNGYHIDAGNHMVMSIGTAGEVTIKDSRGDGYIYSGYNNEGGILVFGSFTIEGGEIRNGNGGSPIGFAAAGSTPKIAVKGGSLTTTGTVLFGVGSVNLEISNGTISGNKLVGNEYGIPIAGLNNTVTGGTFVGVNPTAYVDTNNYQVSESNGTYTVQPIAPAVTYVAEVNGTQYETLEAALDAASSGDTVELIADIDYSTTYTVRNARDDGNGHAVDLKDCILDMNGHTIKSINATVTFGGSNATIKNGTFDLVEKNTDGSYKDGSYALIIDNYVNGYGTNGKVTLENLTIDGGLNIKKAIVDVTNCTSRTTTTGYYAIWTEDDAVVTVNSGTYAAGNATNASSEGVIATGTSTKTGFDHEAGSKLYIKGGSFNANGDKLVPSHEEGSIIITGGTFDTDPTAYVDTENYEVIDNNGTYTVQAKVTYVAQIGTTQYETLAAAVEAAEDGDTITLIDNFSIDGSTKIEKSVTIDGNNKVLTITGGNAASGVYYALNINDNDIGRSVDVTIKDLTLNTTGYQVAVMLIGDYSSKVSLENVDITTDGACVYANGHAQLDAEGCTFVRNGEYTSGKDAVYYSALLVGYGADMSVADCTVTSDRNGAATFPSGGAITLTNTDITITGSGDAIWSRNEDYTNYPEYLKDSVINFQSGNVVGGFKITDKYTGDHAKNEYDAVISITGGKFSADPTAYVAEGYEAVGISESPYLFQVGEIKATDLTEQGLPTETSATYIATREVVDEEGDVINNASSKVVTVTLTTATTTESVASNNVLSQYAAQELVDEALSKAGDATEVNISIDVVKDDPEVVNNTITYEVHPEATVTVGGTEVGTFQVSNDQLSNASFTITLPVPDALAAKGFVDVVHKHSDSETPDDTYSNVKVDGTAGNYTVTITGVTSFSEFSISVSADLTHGFRGTSLRRRVWSNNTNEVVNHETDIRFGFIYTLPAGKEVDMENSYFQWGFNEDLSDRTHYSVQSITTEDASAGIYSLNLIINAVPSTYFDTKLYAKLTLTYNDGSYEEFSSDSNGVTIYGVCEALKAKDGVSDAWKDYADYLLGNSDSTYLLNSYAGTYHTGEKLY